MTTKPSPGSDPAKRTARIARFNDAFRRGERRGLVHVSAGVMALGWQALLLILDMMRAFDAFDAASDPTGEHASGSFPIAHATILWTIAYLADDHVTPSPDPAKQSVTTRKLRIRLAGEQ